MQQKLNFLLLKFCIFFRFCRFWNFLFIFCFIIFLLFSMLKIFILLFLIILVFIEFSVLLLLVCLSILPVVSLAYYPGSRIYGTILENMMVNKQMLKTSQILLRRKNCPRELNIAYQKHCKHST